MNQLFVVPLGDGRLLSTPRDKVLILHFFCWCSDCACSSYFIFSASSYSWCSARSSCSSSSTSFYLFSSCCWCSAYACSSYFIFFASYSYSVLLVPLLLPPPPLPLIAGVLVLSTPASPSPPPPLQSRRRRRLQQVRVW